MRLGFHQGHLKVGFGRRAMYGIVRPGIRGKRQCRRYRALFLSDVHLGTQACRASSLLSFLEHNDADTIYLVGDIIDFSRIKRFAIWPQAHSDVLQAFLRKLHSGAKIVYVPGNHDEGLRDYCGTHLNGIEVVRDCLHTTANGRRLLVIHGDEFDVVVRYAKWLAFVGNHGDRLALWFAQPMHWLRRRFGVGLWSLSSYLKLKVKTAVNIVGKFEAALMTEAKRRGAEGVVCGHIHVPARRMAGDGQYLNCGDWVDSCTAIGEDATGELHVIYWLDGMGERQQDLVAQPLQREAA
jgi:UDP-2,3-diacylglucosamine pyrophosphatase LpxH